MICKGDYSVRQGDAENHYALHITAPPKSLGISDISSLLKAFYDNDGYSYWLLLKLCEPSLQLSQERRKVCSIGAIKRASVVRSDDCVIGLFGCVHTHYLSLFRILRSFVRADDSYLCIRS